MNELDIAIENSKQKSIENTKQIKDDFKILKYLLVACPDIIPKNEIQIINVIFCVLFLPLIVVFSIDKPTNNEYYVGYYLLTVLLSSAISIVFWCAIFIIYEDKWAEYYKNNIKNR